MVRGHGSAHTKDCFTCSGNNKSAQQKKLPSSLRGDLFWRRAVLKNGRRFTACRAKKLCSTDVLCLWQRQADLGFVIGAGMITAQSG